MMSTYKPPIATISSSHKRWPRPLVPLVLATAALCLAQAASAAIVINQLPDQVSGTNMDATRVAEDFTVSATTNITNLRFWSVQSAAADYSGSVFWAIFSNVGGSPGALLFGGAPVARPEVLTGLSTGFAYAEYVLDIPVAFQLAPGTYWLGLSDGTLNFANPTEMLWETSAAANGSASKYLDPVLGWLDAGNNLAFRIDGTPVVVPPGLPEPGTLALLALGFLAAGLSRRNIQPGPNQQRQE